MVCVLVSDQPICHGFGMAVSIAVCARTQRRERAEILSTIIKNKKKRVKTQSLQVVHRKYSPQKYIIQYANRNPRIVHNTQEPDSVLFVYYFNGGGGGG
jgi:hypothetical protein